MPELVTIVLADDAADVRSLVGTRLRLTKRFNVVAEAGTGREAIAAVATHQPDLVLLDVSMPDMDGLDAIDNIRVISPNTAIVMFSGFQEEGLVAEAQRRGAAEFLTKASPIDELGDRLLAILARAEDDRADEASSEPRDDLILQEHLERFRAAFDEAAIGMATMTLTGRIVRSNTALDRLAGQASSLVGTTYQSLLDPADQPTFAELLETATTGAGASATPSLEHRLVCPEACPWVVSTVAAVRDSQERPLYLFLQVQDVTERHTAEEELRQSEERFRLLVEGVGDYAIFMLDPNGVIASWNWGAQRIKGYSAHEAIGQHFSIFYTEEDRARNHPMRELAIASVEGRYEEERPRIRRDGSTFVANVVITALRDSEGELIGFAKVTRDVTERRRMLDQREEAAATLAEANARLARAAADRTQFLAIAAHELRTPVAVVHGFASTLRDHWADLDDKERLQMTEAVARGGERLTRLVDDLLTASRLEAEALDVRVGRVALRPLLEEAALDADPDGTVEVTSPDFDVVADRGRVEQMVGNYLSNALRYGAPPVSVSVAAVSDRAEIRVRDAGPGVNDVLLPRLFGKFERGGHEGSTGLGLFIVRELALAQDGDAWYEADDADGACFVISLPLAR